MSYIIRVPKQQEKKMNYFTEYTNPESLRQEYLKLSLQLHPDKGGNTEEFKIMQNEYEQILKTGKVFENQNAGESWKFSFSEESERKFYDIISKIVHLPIEIEICGSWIWLNNTDKSQKEIFKELGFRWAFKKKSWYYSETKSRSRGKYSMDDIRNKFGSEKVNFKTNHLSRA